MRRAPYSPAWSTRIMRRIRSSRERSPGSSRSGGSRMRAAVLFLPRRGPQGQQTAAGCVDEIVAGHGDTEQRPLDLVAGRHRCGQELLLQLFGANAGGQGARTLGEALPPVLLDPDVEGGDAGIDEEHDGS